MKKIDENDQAEQILNEQAEACRLLLRNFCTCANWPKDRDGMVGLAENLVKASTRCGIAMQAIVDLCRDSSALCPTAHDIHRVASEMKVRMDEAKRQNQEAQWRKQFGKADPEFSRRIVKQAAANVKGMTAKQRTEADLKDCLRRAIWNTLYYVEGKGAGDEGFWRHAYDHHKAEHPTELEQIRAEWLAAGGTAEPPEYGIEPEPPPVSSGASNFVN